jgi:hypothetical protein
LLTGTARCWIHRRAPTACGKATCTSATANKRAATDTNARHV